MADYKKPTVEKRRVLSQALPGFISAGLEYEKNPQPYVWSQSVRIERLQGAPVMAMTWSNSGPDGRATFQLDVLDGELRVTWRRIGRHGVYQQP